MTWFKVDDKFADHPKVESLSMAARGLWVTAGAWCASHLTDGHVTKKRIRALGGTPSQCANLVANGLWFSCSQHENCYAFHDWNEYQPTRESEQNRKLEQAERQQRSRERREREQAQQEIVTRDDLVTSHVTSRVSHASPTRAPARTPTRPDPTRSSGQVLEGGSPQQTRETATAPDPVTRGSLALVVSAAPDADPEPDSKCARHRTRIGRIDEPCAACRDARLAHEAWTDRTTAAALAERLAATTARRAAINACTRCDEFGWQLDHTGQPTDPARRCTHEE
ncbi:hypothetical protein SEA_ZIPP_57 [Gordonia phage Zipp]|uniref:Helix-turn-helix DNA binding domain protein n=1 Tax=Gordonia phage Zipp TaxID=2591212 RepID=A0A514DHW5_9CAUD|nr:replication initiation protein [Gordonia phage Zipp]QDH93211.1 hypothetical protein SEA_ZIPP_57 [Gordonia phage Zipp]